MALTPGVPPNVWAFWSRLFEFEPMGFAVVQTAIDMAVDELNVTSWRAKDYPYAVMYLAAHMMAIRLSAIQSAARGKLTNLSTDLFARSVGFGERRVMWGERTIARNAGYKYGPGEGLYEQTAYGQKFLELRARNIPAVALI